jgi:hypothetical protein
MQKDAIRSNSHYKCRYWSQLLYDLERQVVLEQADPTFHWRNMTFVNISVIRRRVALVKLEWIELMIG